MRPSRSSQGCLRIRFRLSSGARHHSAPPSAVSSFGGFRTPAAEHAAPSLMRPASETLHNRRHCALKRQPTERQQKAVFRGAQKCAGVPRLEFPEVRRTGHNGGGPSINTLTNQRFATVFNADVQVGVTVRGTLSALYWPTRVCMPPSTGMIAPVR
jgi:hypothetical protein